MTAFVQPERFCTHCLSFNSQKVPAVAVLYEWDEVARFGCAGCARAHCAFIKQTRTDQRQLSVGSLGVETLKSFFDRATADLAERALAKMRDP